MNKAALEFESIYNAWFDTVYRVCFMYFSTCTADCEDAVQATFLKYIEAENKPCLGESEHLKAWLITTAQNTCKSMLRLKHRKDVGLDSVGEVSRPFEYGEAMQAILALPEKERLAVYLCLYEEYTAAQAAKIIGCREGTVHSYIHRARKKLKKMLGE